MCNIKWFSRQGMKQEDGFTLVELMIVVAIIGILAAIAIPQFQAYRTRSYNANAKAVNKNMVGNQSDLNAELGAYGETTATANFLVDPVLPATRGAGVAMSSNLTTALTQAATATVAGGRLSGTQGVTAKSFAVPLGLGAAMMAFANTPAQLPNFNTSTSYIIVTRHLLGDTAYGSDSDNPNVLYSVSNVNWVGVEGILATVPAAVTNADAFDADNDPTVPDVFGNGAPSANWAFINY